MKASYRTVEGGYEGIVKDGKEIVWCCGHIHRCRNNVGVKGSVSNQTYGYFEWENKELPTVDKPAINCSLEYVNKIPDDEKQKLIKYYEELYKK